MSRSGAISSPVRNTSIPKMGGARPESPQKQVSREAVAKRAYEIWASGKGGSQLDNWLRAERELRSSY